MWPLEGSHRLFVEELIADLAGNTMPPKGSMMTAMAQPLESTIREVLLAEIEAQDPKGRFGGPELQQGPVLDAAARKLRANHNQTWSVLFSHNGTNCFAPGFSLGV